MQSLNANLQKTFVYDDKSTLVKLKQLENADLPILATRQ